MWYQIEIINDIRDELLKKHENIAVAESVTAGYVQAALSAGMDASKYFQGGITAYNLGQKARHLNIDPIAAQSTNCVTMRIADTMAIEVSKMFLSNYGIAITGFASIVPECEKDGLFAYYSIAYNQHVVHNGKISCTEQDPAKVQVSYANQLLEKLHNYLKHIAETSDAQLVL